MADMFAEFWRQCDLIITSDTVLKTNFKRATTLSPDMEVPTNNAIFSGYLYPDLQKTSSTLIQEANGLVQIPQDSLPKELIGEELEI